MVEYWKKMILDSWSIYKKNLNIGAIEDFENEDYESNS